LNKNGSKINPIYETGIICSKVGENSTQKAIRGYLFKNAPRNSFLSPPDQLVTDATFQTAGLLTIVVL